MNIQKFIFLIQVYSNRGVLIKTDENYSIDDIVECKKQWGQIIDLDGLLYSLCLQHFLSHESHVNSKFAGMVLSHLYGFGQNYSPACAWSGEMPG